MQDTFSKLLSRRSFLKQSSKGLAYLALNTTLPNIIDLSQRDYFYFGVLSDTHIIDDQYLNDSSWFTNLTIHKANSRFKQVQTTLNQLDVPLDMVFITGDFIHNHPSQNWDYYFKNHTRFDAAREIIDGFNVPVYPGLGNHDYSIDKLKTTDPRSIRKEFTHDLFRNKFGVEPYYSIHHKGHRFIHLNNFLGNTYRAGHEQCNLTKGSFGEIQLNWLQAELESREPTFLFTHYPMQLLQRKEFADLGLSRLLKKYNDTVLGVFSGHMHLWLDFRRTFGPRHMVTSSTRLDDNSFMVIRVNRRNGSFKVLNYRRILWQTPWARPYRQAA